MTALEAGVPFDADIHFWAFRYALGRRTYAVSDVSMALIARKRLLPERMREMICREITEAEERGALGHECDKRAWLEVRAQLQTAQPSRVGQGSEADTADDGQLRDEPQPLSPQEGEGSSPHD